MDVWNRTAGMLLQRIEDVINDWLFTVIIPTESLV